ncbi:MAG: adhesin [Desulfovibrio sp.]|nr:MAG: adhesin [Desulfovibrio sp.]
MIEMTDTARQELDKYFADKDKAAIRIFVAAGCGGAQLALALDEASDNDSTFTADGYDFVVDKALADEGQPFSIDMSPMGFAIDSKLEFGGGGCSSGCSGCG